MQAVRRVGSRAGVLPRRHQARHRGRCARPGCKPTPRTGEGQLEQQVRQAIFSASAPQPPRESATPSTRSSPRCRDRRRAVPPTRAARRPVGLQVRAGAAGRDGPHARRAARPAHPRLRPHRRRARALVLARPAPETLLRAAKHYGVDVAQVRASGPAHHRRAGEGPPAAKAKAKAPIDALAEAVEGERAHRHQLGRQHLQPLDGLHQRSARLAITATPSGRWITTYAQGALGRQAASRAHQRCELAAAAGLGARRVAVRAVRRLRPTRPDRVERHHALRLVQQPSCHASAPARVLRLGGGCVHFNEVPHQWRFDLLNLIADAPPRLDWLLRPRDRQRPGHARCFHAKRRASWRAWDGWPNVWLGITVVNQGSRPRHPKLLAVPAAVRFLSIEPMLGPVDLDNCTMFQQHWPRRRMTIPVAASRLRLRRSWNTCSTPRSTGSSAAASGPHARRCTRIGCARYATSARGLASRFTSKQWGVHHASCCWRSTIKPHRRRPSSRSRFRRREACGARRHQSRRPPARRHRAQRVPA